LYILPLFQKWKNKILYYIIMLPISNLNSVLIKNYGQKQETLAIIRELAKLGLIKKKSKPKKERKPKMIEDLKQESDMVGYTKTLGGQTGQFPLRITDSGMTQQQIEDINRSNAARFAALRSEVEQQRLEDIQAQQGQRFSDIQRIGTAVGQIVNPLVERFRGAQESGAGQRESPFPSESSSVIYLEDVPETQDVPMSRTPNPNAPEFTSEFAEEVFPEEETGNISTARQGLEPREKMGGGMAEEELPPGVAFEEIAAGKKPKKKSRKPSTLQEVSDILSLGKVPTISSLKGDVKTYYINLTDALGEDEIVFKNRQEYLDEINRLLKQSSTFMVEESN
jgi:hypothetical protein